jgi:hypothetical protein
MTDKDFEELKDNIRTEIIRAYYEKSPECLTKDTLSRKMICSPLLGAYGFQGFCLAIDGSPPRGSILVFFQPNSNGMFFWDNYKFKNLTNTRSKYVRLCGLIDKLVETTNLFSDGNGKFNLFSPEYANFFHKKEIKGK